jgi:hypothetical protein
MLIYFGTTCLSILYRLNNWFVSLRCVNFLLYCPPFVICTAFVLCSFSFLFSLSIHSNDCGQYCSFLKVLFPPFSFLHFFIRFARTILFCSFLSSFTQLVSISCLIDSLYLICVCLSATFIRVVFFSQLQDWILYYFLIFLLNHNFFLHSSSVLSYRNNTTVVIRYGRLSFVLCQWKRSYWTSSRTGMDPTLVFEKQ